MMNDDPIHSDVDIVENKTAAEHGSENTKISMEHVFHREN